MKGTAPLGAGMGGVGTAHLALKRQANQISPFQGAGGDKPLPYVQNAFRSLLTAG